MGALIIALAISVAKGAVAPVADLIDNSGGAASNGALDAVPLSNTAPAIGANVPTKAAAEASLVAVKDYDGGQQKSQEETLIHHIKEPGRIRPAGRDDNAQCVAPLATRP